MAIVYLIHFDTKYRHAQHYLGYTDGRLEDRMNRHRNGSGGRLMGAVTAAGIAWSVVRTWELASWREARALERRLKRWHGARLLCPSCKTANETPKQKTSSSV